MKERPILFSGPMVRAILDGRKTQTRRVVKLPHSNPLGQWEPMTFGGPNGGRTSSGETVPLQGGIWHTRTGECLSSPHGQPGDRLWVRETWNWEKNAIGAMRDEDGPFAYAASPMCGSSIDGKWRPSIHMPRWASRITLQVIGVRAERLQEIDWEDAIAEGIRDPRRAAWRVDPVEGCVAKYRELWDSLNAERGHGWDTNPWVWVVEFRRMANVGVS